MARRRTAAAARSRLDAARTQGTLGIAVFVQQSGGETGTEAQRVLQGEPGPQGECAREIRGVEQGVRRQIRELPGTGEFPE